MRTTIRTICWLVIVVATGFTVAAILNGKVLGDRVFMASKDDMITAAVACALAFVAALLLIATKPAVVTRNRTRHTGATDPIYVAALLEWAHVNLQPGVDGTQLRATANALRTEYIES